MKLSDVDSAQSAALELQFFIFFTLIYEDSRSSAPPSVSELSPLLETLPFMSGKKSRYRFCHFFMLMSKYSEFQPVHICEDFKLLFDGKLNDFEFWSKAK